VKALIFSIGTRGDIEPFLAIAQLLKQKGWEVTCTFPEQFRQDVEEMNFKFHGFSREFLELMHGRDARTMMGGKGNFFKRVSTIFRLAKEGIRISRSVIALQHRVLMDENADLVIYHPKCNYCVLWGMVFPGKTRMVSPVPIMAHPLFGFTPMGKRTKTWLSRLLFWLVNTIKAIAINRSASPLKKEFPEQSFSIRRIKRQILQHEHTIYTISKSLFPRPDYWPSTAHVAGYFERDKFSQWTPPDGLEDFLSRYQKIICVTFGSMINDDPKTKSKIIVDVLPKNKIPAVINTSWGGLEKVDGSPEHIFYLDSAPYDWLFPKMYAVVHHGGSGTTHTATKYGCPSLIIPHIVDQFFWNVTIAELRLGPLGLPIAKLRQDEFELMLLDLLANQAYKQNALTAAKEMALETDWEHFYTTLTG
jgi:sterol 3beta-glucosyltransferase